MRLGSVYIPITFFCTVSASSERKIALFSDLLIFSSLPVSGAGAPVPTSRFTRPSFGSMTGNSAAGLDVVLVLGVRVDAAVELVEPPGDLARQLQVRELVFADRHQLPGGTRGCRRTARPRRAGSRTGTCRPAPCRGSPASSVGLRITRLNGMSIEKKNVSSSIAGTSLWTNIVALVRVDARRRASRSRCRSRSGGSRRACRRGS